MMKEIIQIQKAYSDAPPIRRADNSAAGTMPAAAFKYCEAMRVASGFGWYVYPPKDISLLFDGKEVFYHENDHWMPVKSLNFEDSFRREWDRHAPEDLVGYDPPFMTELFVPGIVQIWSGYFISSKADWSVIIRPIVNADNRSLLTVYEGIVETDQFKPMPLFLNVKLLKTDIEIYLHKNKPLFQIQPIMRSNYQIKDDWLSVHDGIDNLDHPLDWDGVRKTVKKVDGRDKNSPGTYAVSRRKR